MTHQTDETPGQYQAGDQELSAGYTTNQGLIYHFEHIPMKAGLWQIDQARENVYVIETINTTYANGDPARCHHNKYFVVSLAAAIGTAACLQLSFEEAAETVVNIRLANGSEIDKFWAAFGYFFEREPGAISEDQINERVKLADR